MLEASVLVEGQVEAGLTDIPSNFYPNSVTAGVVAAVVVAAIIAVGL